MVVGASAAILNHADGGLDGFLFLIWTFVRRGLVCTRRSLFGRSILLATVIRHLIYLKFQLIKRWIIFVRHPKYVVFEQLKR